MLIAADRVVIGGTIQRDVGIQVDGTGRIARVSHVDTMGTPDLTLDRRILLPGFVNAHSHAFQRLLRGRTQRAGPGSDTFWTWRDAMYHVASKLDPVGIYIASRQAFTEMLLAGVTTVGEFHYIHHQPGGIPYDDCSEMGDAVARAAMDAGIRFCMLRVIYMRGDFDEPADGLQKRFCEPTLEDVWNGIENLFRRMQAYESPLLTWGVAAHSVRAVPPDAVIGIKTSVSHLPFHIHVSEQRREVDGCIRHYGAPPVELLGRQGVLDSETTLVHATHLRAGEAKRIEGTGASVCVCPTTEADLGDGLVDASDLFKRNVPLCLGTDGQTTSSILEEARRLEMHERLRTERRNLLVRGEGDWVAKHVLDAATVHGARALDVMSGRIDPGYWADFVAFDMDTPELAGLTDEALLGGIMFSADTRAIGEVIVGGRVVVEGGQHCNQEEITPAYTTLANEIFA